MCGPWVRVWVRVWAGPGMRNKLHTFPRRENMYAQIMQEDWQLI